MKTIIVDDEQIMLRQLGMELRKNSQVELVGSFCLSSKALAYAKEHKVEAAFLDIEMPTMNGIELGKKLKEIYPDIIIVYVTGYSDYVKEAVLDVKSDGYLLKPYSEEDIKEVLRKALLLSLRQRKNVHIHTFGNFDVYIQGVALTFSNAKAKELLAICVDRIGGEVAMEEAVEKLWGNRPYDNRVKNLYRKSVSYLNRLFETVGYGNLFQNKRGRCNVNIQEFDCDYIGNIMPGYEYSNMERFSGSYMIEYPWARETEKRLADI
ncbi:MAG: response regulator [Anaerostipes sp.]|jgi:two-component SAPR family response regulator|nr:response regulator [Anaerostipes sp.]MDD3746151.1 response regulator [Anaerostipes sp.]